MTRPLLVLILAGLLLGKVAADAAQHPDGAQPVHVVVGVLAAMLLHRSRRHLAGAGR